MQPLALISSATQGRPVEVQGAANQHNDDSSNGHTDPAPGDRPWQPLSPDPREGGNGSSAASGGDEDGASAVGVVAALGGREEVSEAIAKAKQEAPLKLFRMQEVAVHNSRADMWLVIDGEVYDVTAFQNEHPGGAKVLSPVAGKDATKKFDKYHRRGMLEKYRPTLRVGLLDVSEAVEATRKGFLQKLGFGRKA